MVHRAESTKKTDPRGRPKENETQIFDDKSSR